MTSIPQQTSTHPANAMTHQQMSKSNGMDTAPNNAIDGPLLQLKVGGSMLTLRPGLTYVIGSSPEAHVHLGGTDVAPRHAQISNDALRVLHATGGTDGSNHVTLLNGKEVQVGVPAPLRDGDII